MANITWTPPSGWAEETGAHVNFKAPCDSAAAGNLMIGSSSYTIVDACGFPSAGGSFAAGAIVDLILDCEAKKAYIQNAATPLGKIAVCRRSSITQSGAHDYWALKCPAEAGCTRVVVAAYTSSPGSIIVKNQDFNGDNIRIYTQNISGGSITFSLTAWVLYVRDENIVEYTTN